MSEDHAVWVDRVHCTLGEFASLYVKVTERELLAAVAARFASRFDADARLYERDKPAWHHRCVEALETLVADGLVDSLHLTDAGAATLSRACERAEHLPERTLTPLSPETAAGRDVLIAGVLTPPLRARLTANPDDGDQPPQPIPIMIEINLRYSRGPRKAMKRIAHLWRYLGSATEPRPLADEYAVGELTPAQIEG